MYAAACGVYAVHGRARVFRGVGGGRPLEHLRRGFGLRRPEPPVSKLTGCFLARRRFHQAILEKAWSLVWHSCLWLLALAAQGPYHRKRWDSRGRKRQG